MRVKITSVLTLLLFLIVSSVSAQNITVSGNVISSEDGLPLPGVSVIVVGTTTGTATDFDGNFEIPAEVGQELEFSFIGFSSQRINVSGSVQDVVMQPDSKALEEVVVVAYGKQSKKSIVGSVVSLDSKVLESQQLTTVTGAIQGNVPGVNILTSGGQPGENPTIRIRGVGSINASADPLIIVDGAPYNGNLNSISQDQIASMNVLKDASSTALYGSRAANGVILITTKKGRKGSEPAITVDLRGGISSQAVNQYERLGAEDYMKLSWEGLKNVYQYENGETAADAATLASKNLIGELGYNPFDVAMPVNMDGNIADGANLLWDTDWESAVLRDVAYRNEAGVTVSGGSENTTYFLSLNYLGNQGTVRTSNFDRITTRLNLESNINSWLKVGMNTSYSTSTQNYPNQAGNSYSSSLQWINSVSNIYPLYERDQNGELKLNEAGEKVYDYGNNNPALQPVNAYRPVFGNENVRGALDYNIIEYNRDNLMLNGFAEVKFNEELNFRSNVSFENYFYDGYEYQSSLYGVAQQVGGRVSQNRDFTKTTNVINSLNYSKEFGDHGLAGTLINEVNQMSYSSLGAQGTGFLPGVNVIGGSTTPESVSGVLLEAGLIRYLARLSYNYQQRYFIEGSFSRDGSSKFHKDVRWGNFFSVGGSWVISDESFFENVDVVNLLKLKSSYGELGNNRGIGYFPYVSQYETGYNNGANPGVILAGLVDPLLTWEKTSSFNIGLDFGLYNSRISGTVEYYNKESIDLIYDKPLPPSIGTSSIKTNVGSLRNYGLEFTVNTINIESDNFRWTSNFNFSLDRNKITSLTQDAFVNGTKRWEVGRSIYDFWIREYAGVDPEDGYAMWYVDVLDENGEPTGEKETTKRWGEATRYYQGSSLPSIVGGFTNTLTYGNFDMNILMNFSLGGKVYDSSYAGLNSGFSRVGFQQHVDANNRWQKPGDETDYPLLLTTSQDFSSASTRFLFDNDYLRVKAISLGYNLSANSLNSLGVEKLRVYFQGDNLFTFSTIKGIDPEQSLAGTTDSRSYLMKTFSLGVNVKF